MGPSSVHPALQLGWWTGRQQWFQAFPFQQFHVLFNSLFRVLFIFPSRYLFAIGLLLVFSFRWNLPPIWGCIPKQPDSWKALYMGGRGQQNTGLSPAMASRIPTDFCHPTIPRFQSCFYKLQFAEVKNPGDFKFELFPFHSPLLGESSLVSFPPLINMLKFSGYSYLIWGQVVYVGGHINFRARVGIPSK